MNIQEKNIFPPLWHFHSLFHDSPGHTHKASAGGPGVVQAVLVYILHTADLVPVDN